MHWRGETDSAGSEEGREPGELCAILFRSFVARTLSVWTISITTVLKFNDSEPNELHLDKFAFVGFVALVPRNTVNLTREPTGVMNYGEYEFVRPFFILHRPPLPPCSFSAIQRIPRIQSCLNPTQVSLDTPVNNTPYHSIVAHLDGFSRDGNVVRQKRKHCHAVW